MGRGDKILCFGKLKLDGGDVSKCHQNRFKHGEENHGTFSEMNIFVSPSNDAPPSVSS